MCLVLHIISMQNNIRILSDSEIACIAAGEVIESPASIFKELIENAIDAGSTDIVISYKKSGLEYIQISDNGSGIAKDDLLKVFMLHATSKLNSINDIYYKNNIYFGFRGEAVAAISGVSKTEIISREHNQDIGYTVIFHHGKQITPITPIARNPGTTVTVTELFSHIPARKKYIEAIKNIEKDIKHTILAIIAMHPHINFSIYRDDLLQKHYYAKNSVTERMHEISHQEPNKMIAVSYSDNYITIEGIMSASEYGWYDKSRIYVFVNKRIIKQSNLINRCTKPYYAQNFVKRYPELYLNLEVVPDQVDVNVHPRKEEVLFLYQHKIENILESVIIKHLEKHTHTTISCKNDTSIIADHIPHLHTVTNETILQNTSTNNTTTPQNNISEKTKHPAEKSDIDLEQKNIKHYSKNDEKTRPYDISIQKNHIPNNATNIYTPHDTAKNKPEKYVYQQEPLIYQQQTLFEKDRQQEAGKFIGILNNTYILLLKQKSIICIDQHALHEKILYEKYNATIDKTMFISHPLLLPHRIKKNHLELKYIQEYHHILTEYGFSIQYDENEIILSGCPQIFLDSYESIINKYIDAISHQGDGITQETMNKIIMHDIFATKACKNAIKAGDHLSHEMVELLIENSHHYNVSFCPHGRPTYYEITTDLLDTLCKRK
jgi:DNA mismatch repair protein MutL